MADRFKEAFRFQPLDRFSFKERFIIRAAGFLFSLSIRIVGLTLRFETEGAEHLESNISGKNPILVFWHDRIVSGTYYFRGRSILVLSSTSFDSEYTARCIQRFGFGVIKGSSTRGGVQGLVNMIRAVRSGYSVAFTLDGPKGPRYVAKSGPVLLAKKTGAPMVPFILESKHSWKLKSWDRLLIPKPFSRVKLIVDEPIFVAPESDDDEIERKRQELQGSLDALVERGNNVFSNE